jgi:hypothetical protein
LLFSGVLILAFLKNECAGWHYNFFLMTVEPEKADAAIDAEQDVILGPFINIYKYLLHIYLI